MILRQLVALALPPRCPACGIVVDADHRFCVGCWSKLRFLGPPWCAACATPFPHDPGPGTRCAPCLANPPRHGGVRAAVAYGPVSSALALKLKYGRRLAVADTMAGLMLRHLPAEADLLLPVPLHPARIWTRGFNQAALMAAILSRRSGVAVENHALVRTRATPSLRDLNRDRRARAVRGAFAVKQPDQLRGRNVVLIDDVHTTGATADACTRVLLRAGAASVVILCWARVLDRPD